MPYICISKLFRNFIIGIIWYISNLHLVYAYSVIIFGIYNLSCLKFSIHKFLQEEVVGASLVDVIHAVLAGHDGCVLSFGGCGLGKTYTMLGTHTCRGQLGVIPTGIAWLYKAIQELKGTTGARFSVRVSAVAIDAPGTAVCDLLAHCAQNQGNVFSYLIQNKCILYLSFDE